MVTKEKKKNVNMNLPEKLVKIVSDLAIKEKRSFSSQVEYMLEQVLNEEDDITTKDLMIASESSLKKVWDTPEEDEAWKDL